MSLIRATLLGCAAPVAHAEHWPMFGGDAGRSGNQPVDEGVTPVEFEWSETGGEVKTSPVITAGALQAQRLAYGTTDGRVHFHELASGDAVGPAAGTAIDEGADDADVFGTQSAVPGDNGASTSFADTSAAEALGQLFAAHNDGNDIEIAQFDEAGGSLVQQFDVPGTTGLTIESSLLATPASDGSRELFFVAGGQLFKVHVDDAQSVSAAFGAVTSTADVSANPLGSPTLAYLDVLGTPTAHIAIGTDGAPAMVRTYRVSDLGPGPAGALPLGAVEARTPSVPVQPDGTPPSPGSPVETAPFVYVAGHGSFPFFPFDDPAADDTMVYKLRQNGTSLDMEGFIPIPDTLPAPALAVTQEAEPGIEEDHVLVTTTSNLFVFTTYDMDLSGEFDYDVDGAPGTDGFQQPTAAASGGLFYVINDQGDQFIGRVSDGKPVPEDEVVRPEELTPPQAPPASQSNGGVGQPAISRGFVAFGGPDGVFVYRNQDATPPSVALTAPEQDATVSGNNVRVAATAFDARGIDQVEFRANGRTIGTVATPDSGSAFGAPGAIFSIVLDSDALPSGEYVLDAVATDGGGLDATSEPRRVVVRTRGEDGPPAVQFTSPSANAVLSRRATLSATATDDRGIKSVSFLAADRVLCTDTTAPYSCIGELTGADVGRPTLIAIATDSADQTAVALQPVRVSRFGPAGLSARVSPSRDRSAPYRFTTRGTLTLPTGVTRAQGCGSGIVSVQFKAGSKTVSTRRTTLTRSCTFSSSVSFRSRSRFTRSGQLKVTARFGGNSVLGLRSARSVFVRTK